MNNRKVVKDISRIIHPSRQLISRLGNAARSGSQLAGSRDSASIALPCYTAHVHDLLLRRLLATSSTFSTPSTPSSPLLSNRQIDTSGPKASAAQHKDIEPLCDTRRGPPPSPPAQEIRSERSPGIRFTHLHVAPYDSHISRGSQDKAHWYRPRSLARQQLSEQEPIKPQPACEFTTASNRRSSSPGAAARAVDSSGGSVRGKLLDFTI